MLYMIDVLIALVRTSGQDLERYTKYRQQWELRTKATSINGGRKGGNGEMKVSTKQATNPHPVNVLYEELF